MPPHPSRFKIEGQGGFDGFSLPPAQQPSRAAMDRQWREERDARNRALHIAREAWSRAAVTACVMSRQDMVQALVNGIEVEGYGRLGATSGSHVSRYVEDEIQRWRKLTGSKAYRPKPARVAPNSTRAPSVGRVKGTTADIACPVCLAGTWEACVDPSSSRQKGAGIFHKERHIPTSPREMVCPTCAVKRGRACKMVGIGAARRAFHATREAYFRSWHVEFNQHNLDAAHVNALENFNLQLYDMVAVLDEYVALDTVGHQRVHPNAKIVAFLPDRLTASVEYLSGEVRVGARLQDLQKLATDE